MFYESGIQATGFLVIASVQTVPTKYTSAISIDPHTRRSLRNEGVVYIPYPRKSGTMSEGWNVGSSMHVNRDAENGVKAME